MRKILKTVFRSNGYKAKYCKGELEHGKFLAKRSRNDTFKAKKKIVLRKLEIQPQKKVSILIPDLNSTRINIIAVWKKKETFQETKHLTNILTTMTESYVPWNRHNQNMHWRKRCPWVLQSACCLLRSELNISDERWVANHKSRCPDYNLIRLEISLVTKNKYRIVFMSIRWMRQFAEQKDLNPTDGA